MSAVARSVRPFASRVLSQKLPLAAARRVSPAMGFPRGTIRSFSQSPLSTDALNSVLTEPLALSSVQENTNYLFLRAVEVKKYSESHEWIELADNGKTG